MAKNSSATAVRYGNSGDAWRDFVPYLERQIEARGIRRVMDVGGGANPALPLELVDRLGLEYTVLDISAQELAKAPAEYLKVQADIADPHLNLSGGYQLIFSKLLAEHIRGAEAFHRNVHALLAPGGIAYHYFPTLYAFPFVVNRLFPEKLAEGLVHLIQSGRQREGRRAKFPAYYQWCRGPSARMIRRFEALGYRVEEYNGFYGHDPYYEKLPWLLHLHQRLTEMLIHHPVPWLTSFAYVRLLKPA